MNWKNVMQGSPQPNGNVFLWWEKMESAGRESGRGMQRKDTEQESRQNRDQDRHKATQIKNQKCVMQDRDGKSRACAAKMTSDRKCHRGQGRKSNQAARSEVTRQTGADTLASIQVP